MTVNGENSVPLGRAGTGAAYILHNTGPNALSLLAAGQSARARAAQQAKLAQDKLDAERAKQFLDDSKYNQDGSVYFGQALNEKVYQPLTGKLNSIYGQRELDAMGRAAQVRPLKQQVDNETVQSKAKTQYIKDTLAGLQNNPLYDAKYATEHLTKSMPAGTLPSQFDEEAWKANLLGDHHIYNEGEVVARTSKKLLDDVTSRVSQAGTLGGTHVMEQTRGQLMAFDANHRPILNADGGHKINLTKEVDTMLDSDPAFKLKTDARLADYEAKRQASIVAHAADPSVPELPVMTRRGIHAQMIEPLLHYDVTRDEGLNAQVRQPRATAASSGAQIAAFNEREVAPAEVGATVNPRSPFENFFGFGPDVQQGFYTSRRSAAPSIPQKNGTRKPVESQRLYSKVVLQEDGRGNLSRNDNNKTSMSGYYGEAHQLPVDPKTGEVKLPKDKADEAALLAKGYKPQTFVAFYTDKNENFNGDYKRNLADLVSSNEKEYDPSRKKTPTELEETARKMASKGVARKFIPYTDNAGTINADAGRYYADFHQGTINAGKSVKVPAAPSKPTGGLYPAAKPTTKTAPKAEKVKGWY